MTGGLAIQTNAMEREPPDDYMAYRLLRRTFFVHSSRSEFQRVTSHNEVEFAMNDFGIVTDTGTVKFERLLPGPIERVWAYLTESEKRGRWLASGHMDLRPCGRVELFFRHKDLSPVKESTPEKYKHYDQGETSHGRIVRVEAPRLLIFTWDEHGGTESEVTFELAPRGSEVLLTVIHKQLRDRAARISVCGGWHTHLAILQEHLAGRKPQPFWSAFATMEVEYDRRVPK